MTQLRQKVFMYTKKNANVAVGDLIQVDGEVEEYVGPGYAERFEQI